MEILCKSCNETKSAHHQTSIYMNLNKLEKQKKQEISGKFELL